MNKFFDSMDTKTVATVITSAGGIILALMLVRGLVGNVSARMGEIAESISNHESAERENDREIATVLRDITKAIQESTAATRDLQQLIRSTR